MHVELSEEQFALVEHLLALQLANVSIDNLSVLNGILYVAVNGCTWRGLPRKYGRWHTVYTRMSRWVNGRGTGRVSRITASIRNLRLTYLRPAQGAPRPGT
jgi:transposase